MREEVLLLLVVDMTDLPGSIFRALPDVIGEQKPMIVIGNKVDLLPPDASRGYLRHFKDSLTKAIDEVGFSSRFNILHTTVVSAKTGFGIEELITNIHLKWANPKSEVRSDMFLVGCTNAGKSTLFNTFLQSDMCKVRAVDLIERATTSVWPGTTLNLLKFPVMNPVPYKLEVRRRRLNQTNAWLERERKLRQQLLSETGEAQYAVLQGCVENSFEEQHKESQPISEREFVARQKSERQMFVEEPATKKDSPKIWDPNEEAFAGGSWCFDTPGTVTEDQIINKLTLEELIVVVPKQLIRPRTSLIYPGQSLLLGGLGRIDIGRASGERRGTIMLTVFASDQLPVHVMPTEHVERFVSKYNGTKELGAPLGGPDRLKLLPGMRSRPLSITGKGAKESAADITLSSTGWVAVTAPSGTTVELFAYTPGGVGIITRPSFLPFAVNQRGARIPGTNSYKVRPLGSYEEKYRSRREFLKPRRRRDSLFNGRNDDEDEDDDEMSPVAL
uniref:G domain-containing protein n=1 Tax=Plectus sambesii TaxID=2011161 RepID=A0A914XK78_9BILA